MWTLLFFFFLFSYFLYLYQNLSKKSALKAGLRLESCIWRQATQKLFSPSTIFDERVSFLPGIGIQANSNEAYCRVGNASPSTSWSYMGLGDSFEITHMPGFRIQLTDRPTLWVLFRFFTTEVGLTTHLAQPFLSAVVQRRPTLVAVSFLKSLYFSRQSERNSMLFDVSMVGEAVQIHAGNSRSAIIVEVERDEVALYF